MGIIGCQRYQMMLGCSQKYKEKLTEEFEGPLLISLRNIRGDKINC